MRTIDLTQELFDGMPVFPGDPEVEIKQVHTLDNEGWRLSTISLPTHISTHVNVPSHMAAAGKTLTDYPVEAFFGECRLYEPGMEFRSDQGVIFHSQNIAADHAAAMIKQPPKFVGLAAVHEFDIPLERQLLEAGIISFESLANTDQLPQGQTFEFFGVPLLIRQGDGSPVRAFARM